ncbi:UPF0103-domain-containing protein [Sporormia fimetaria CBS 119925]|uniref:UPF0103-domain-containing protein n=1 Tax=Sporormia fimetaria CBS 119925 TaxID=1340428 RepID=A0A6A6UZF7_9PLEO|nr:UPF0103-domain-containing protein [Sporormia fimetaria CBS 119925]
MSVRRPTHAGSWYTSNKRQLDSQLSNWLGDVPDSTTPIGTASSQEGEVSIPTPGARAIIAPHAGYSYSGPAAAWAYKSVDWANAYVWQSNERIFLLGPSHHHYLKGAATTSFDYYGTPLGNLPIDKDLVETLAAQADMGYMSASVDEAEHSLEMHLPYIYKMLSMHFAPTHLPPLVPIMVGSTSPTCERRLGRLLAPYLSNPLNIFILSSDFCHWGDRFRYTYYAPLNGSRKHLRSDRDVSDRPIHESIAAVDKESMDAVESGSHETFLKQLAETGNTVCGRHPIGVFMAAVEKAELDREGGKGRFKFVRYERSSLVEEVGDSSVSYCSAFAVL